MTAVRILDFAPELAPHFKAINEEWISGMYVLEEADRRVLDDPQGQIIAKGGVILFAEADGLGVVGCCALEPMGEGAWELIKMGVLERARGLKIGERLLEAAVARARSLSAETLFLLSNRKSEAAIHLYAKHGFRHDAEIMARYGAEFCRCDVAMRYVGPSAA